MDVVVGMPSGMEVGQGFGMEASIISFACHFRVSTPHGKVDCILFVLYACSRGGFPFSLLPIL